MFGLQKATLSTGDAKALLARSAVVGFGRSAGRDLYKASNNPWLLLTLFALCGAGYAIYDLKCAQKRHPVTAWSILVGSCFVTFLALASMSGLVVAITGTLLVQGISASVGANIAERKRGPLLHAQDIEAANLAFLDEEGFHDVGGRQGTVIDRYGNELIPDDQRADAFVFRILGRRSVRAYIWLDDEGRMVEYEPPTGTQISAPPRLRVSDQPVRAREAEADAEAFDHGDLSFLLTEEQAVELLERINRKTYRLIQEFILHACDDGSALAWQELQDLTGCPNWSSFNRSIKGPLHRELRTVTGDKKAKLLLDERDVGLDDESDPEDRVLFLQGPVVLVLKRVLTPLDA